MARIETDPNYTAPTFSRATAGTDLFKKEDVQALAAAMSTHDHTSGKGLTLPAGSIPNGTITSAHIADGTIVAGDIADGAITSAKILDGTIATADHADASVTNVKLASDTARANLLTNGGFEVWQRGNGPFTTNVIGPDRWALGWAAASTISVSRETAICDVGSAASAKIVHGFSSSFVYLQQVIKASDSMRLAGKTLTFSLRVMSSVVGTVRVALGSDGTGATQPYSSYNATTGWETVSVTYTCPADATVTNISIFIENASCTAYIDNATLVVGSVAADYAPLHPADDLARCQRYYEIMGEVTGSMMHASYQTAGGTYYTTFVYKSRKAVAPSVTKVGTWGTSNSSQAGIDVTAQDQFRIAAIATAAGYAWNNNGAGQNVTIEANP